MIGPQAHLTIAPTRLIVDSTPPNMSRHMDFVGQRADKAVVVGFGEMHKGTIVKDVEHYTMSCDECGGDGYYDQRGDVICEGCGMMLNHKPSVLDTEFSDGDNGVGKSRGLAKMDKTQVGHTPSTS